MRRQDVEDLLAERERARLTRQSVARSNGDGIGNLLLGSNVEEGDNGNQLPHKEECVAADEILQSK